MNQYLERLKTAWNLFLDRDPMADARVTPGPAYSVPQFKKRLGLSNEKSIVGAIYNRIAVDVSMIAMRHVRVDENDAYLETIDSRLNSCLELEANIDQSNTDFMQDVVMSLFDEGVVALVPVDTSVSLVNQNAFDILTMRTGRVVQWYPHHVRLSVYNDNLGDRQELTLHKSKVGIVYNPFYQIMNERMSIAKRLIDKLNLMDVIDEQSGNGKLDLIIQLPYVIKSEGRQKQAEVRRKQIETQLKDSKYGIAYTDGTEKVVQLNRPAENNLMSQIEYLTRLLYGQLGISEKILDGTADEKELVSYYNRVVEPVLSAIAKEMKRKFLTKTAQSQGQSIMYFRNMFSIVTPERVPDLADKLIRNEIATSNEMRAVIGWKPSKAPKADELRNPNMPEPEPMDVTNELASLKPTKENNQNGRS